MPRHLLTLALLLCLGLPPRADETDDQVLSQLTWHYRETCDFRRVARIDASIHVRDGAPSLRIAVRARDAALEPAPGFPGVQGENLQTADELAERLLGPEAPLPFQVVEQAQLVRRRFVDGRLVETRGDPQVVEVAAEVPLEEGRWEIAITMDGEVKLRIAGRIEQGPRGWLGRVTRIWQPPLPRSMGGER